MMLMCLMLFFVRVMVSTDTPTVSLATDCPNGPSVRDGFILAGTTASCRCDVKFAGSPPGFAQWYTESGIKLGTGEINVSAILKLNYSSTESRYVCQLDTALHNNTNPQKVVFSPKFAVGPTSISMHISKANPLCPYQNFNYRITCKVPSTSIAPMPLFTISINKKNVISNQTGIYEEDLAKYYLTHRFRPESGGSFRIYCKATNEIFREQSQELVRLLILNEPPRETPILNCLNGRAEPGSNIVYITDGLTANLTCSAEGGYPDVSNVTITCGSISYSDPGTFASFSMTMPGGVNRILCRCSAWHVSECFNRRAEMILSLEKQGDSGSGNSPTNDSSWASASYSLKLGLGIGLGCVVLVLIIVAVVIIFSKRRNTRNTVNLQPDFNSSHSYQYASFLTGRQHPPTPQSTLAVTDDDYDVLEFPTDVHRTSLKVIDNSLKHGRSADSPRGRQRPPLPTSSIDTADDPYDVVTDVGTDVSNTYLKVIDVY